MFERKGMFILVWITLVVYALFLSPKDSGSTKQLISDLLKFHARDINSLVFMLFYAIGLWSVVYSCILLIRDYKNKWFVWLAVIASFFIGSFAILPYLAFNKENKNLVFSRSKTALFLGSKNMGIFLTVISIALFVYGVGWANWSGFVDLWLNNKFINVMTIDFLTLTYLFPLVLKEDMAAREYNNKTMYTVFCMLPLLGACIYLIVRPPLKIKQMGKSKGGMIIDNRR